MPEPLFELEGVSKDYRSVRALDELTVRVEPGAIGLLGPNGAGKSTLIKSLLGLVRLTGGRATVLGLDARTQSRQVRERVGYMPEDDCSIAGLPGVLSVALAGELAGLPARTALRRAHEILDFVTLAEERYREVQTYSTGMRQKIKLAQALIHAPQLVFLDEPTSGLDPRGREKMLRLIRSLAEKKNVSVVVSTHILSDVEACCDQAMILGRGKLLVYETIEELSKTVDASCRVRVDSDARRLAGSLQALGYPAETIADEELRVSGDDAATKVFEVAREVGVVVREVAASRNSLEDTFMKAMRDAGAVSEVST